MHSTRITDIEISTFDLARARREHFRARARGFRFSHALQLLDAEEFQTGWPILAPESLRLVFEDSLDGPEHFSDPNDYTGPTPKHIEAIVAFGRRLPHDARLCVHCFAGASRSTAATLVVAASRGERTPAALVGLLDRRDAHPNALILAMADDLIGCGPLLREVGATVRANSRWGASA